MPERTALVSVLQNRDEIFLNNGNTGPIAPLSITPTDSTDTSYTITFAPQLIDGTYALWIGPSSIGTSPKDFVDLNGTYTNTGNKMNQNGNATNGEFSGDRDRTPFAVNMSDDGDFITGLYTDLQGTTATDGRAPDSQGFINLIGTVEPARAAAIRSMATSQVTGATGTDVLITQVYQQYLGTAPTAAQLSTAQAQSRRVRSRFATSRLRSSRAARSSPVPAAPTPAG